MKSAANMISLLQFLRMKATDSVRYLPQPFIGIHMDSIWRPKPLNRTYYQWNMGTTPHQMSVYDVIIILPGDTKLQFSREVINSWRPWQYVHSPSRLHEISSSISRPVRAMFLKLQNQNLPPSALCFFVDLFIRIIDIAKIKKTNQSHVVSI